MSDLPIVTGSDGKPREAQAVTLFDKATGSSAQLRSTIIPLTATVARPNNATPITAGDIVAGLFTFNFGASGLPAGVILSAQLRRQKATTSAERFRLYLFDALPAQADLSDNTPFPQAWADAASLIGAFDFATPVATVVANAGASLNYEGVRLGADSIQFGNGGEVHGVLVSLDGYTPTAVAGHLIRLVGGA